MLSKGKGRAISVRGLSKTYRIAHEREQHSTLAESMLHRLGRLGGRGKPRAMRRPTHETFYALRDISFEVGKGEVVGIIGQNGAGKSTLLKILTRITGPTEGKIDLYGRVASLLEVGTGFHPELTGQENIYLNGAILGMTRTEVRSKFDEIVDFAGVEKFLDTPVKRYSSGMYVRLAFAVAAHLEPEILIVDEVLAVGDSEFQDKCLDRMRAVSGDGRTVLFVSHNTAAIQSLCQSVMVLEKGERVFTGPAAEGIAFYAGRSAASRTRQWTRPPGQPELPVQFESVNLWLTGRQPAMQLHCEMAIRCGRASQDVFVSLDICDEAQNPLMQALPVPRPFMKMTPGLHKVTLEIDLPPLVPGRYLADPWVGSHFTSTSDYIKRAVAFDITDSPTAGRSFPHHVHNGPIVPVSRAHMEQSHGN